MEPFKEIEKRSFEGNRIILWSQGTNWIVGLMEKGIMHHVHTFSHYKPAHDFYSATNSKADFERSF